MYDFQFWLSLPARLRKGLPEFSKEIQTTNKELMDLDGQIKESKYRLANLVMSEYLQKKDQKINGNVEAQIIEQNFMELMQKLEEKRSNIVANAINITLQELKNLINKLEKKDELSLIQLKNGMQICREIIKKSQEEFDMDQAGKERPLFAMLKIYGEKCLEQIVEKINLILEQLENEENDESESEYMDEEMTDDPCSNEFKIEEEEQKTETQPIACSGAGFKLSQYNKQNQFTDGQSSTYKVPTIILQFQGQSQQGNTPGLNLNKGKYSINNFEVESNIGGQSSKQKNVVSSNKDPNLNKITSFRQFRQINII